MDWCHYRFRSVWSLPVAPDRVFEVLARAEEYPYWWPQVREVRPVDRLAGTARFRSVLPYDLWVTARERANDPAAGRLEIAMAGDLEGWARWTVSGGPAVSRVVYEQEVDVRRPLLRRLAVPGRPLFLLNHAAMMRSGRRGLTDWLAGSPS